MASIPIINILAFKRVPFDETAPDYRDNWSGATPLLEVRTEKGQTTAPLISLGTSVSGGQGIAITYDPDYATTYNGVTYTGASLIRIIINETTLEGLSYAADPADDVVLYYDLHLTPSGGKKFIAFAGTFTISPGATV